MIYNPSPKSLALFGGTFDPIHLGHLQVAERALNTLHLGKIIFIPNSIHPFGKRSEITNADARSNMIKLALEAYPGFDYDLLELQREGFSFAVDTLRHFKKQYPETNLFFLIGGDNLAEFHKWKEPDEILKMAKLIVYQRTGQQMLNYEKNPRILFLEQPVINISSTEIRQRLADAQSCDVFLPAPVKQFIIDKNLYV